MYNGAEWKKPPDHNIADVHAIAALSAIPDSVAYGSMHSFELMDMPHHIGLSIMATCPKEFIKAI
jgi:hypothetical protein